MSIVSVMAIASVAIVVASAVSALAPLIERIGRGSVSFVWQNVRFVALRLPKRKAVWGVVYDADTKRPIPYAKIQLLGANQRVLETRIADSQGKYGFLTRPDSIMIAQDLQVTLRPTARGYAFPSTTKPTIDFHIYNNLYFGEPIAVSEDLLVNFDVPMDPIVRSSKPLVLKSPSVALGAYIAALADAGFWLGLIMVPLNFILAPNPFSLGIVFLYAGTASLRIWGISEHPFGIVTDVQTGRAIPFALITLDDPSGTRVAYTVSDERGRYFMATERGSYIMTVFTPAEIQPGRHTRIVIETRKGWITRAVRL